MSEERKVKPSGWFCVWGWYEEGAEVPYYLSASRWNSPSMRTDKSKAKVPDGDHNIRVLFKSTSWEKTQERMDELEYEFGFAEDESGSIQKDLRHSAKSIRFTQIGVSQCCDLYDYKTGIYVGRFHSISDAALRLNINKSNLSKVLRGIYAQCQGYVAVYPDQEFIPPSPSGRVSKKEIK